MVEENLGLPGPESFSHSVVSRTLHLCSVEIKGQVAVLNNRC